MKYLKTNEEFNNDIEEISETEFFSVIRDYLKTKIYELDFTKEEKSSIRLIVKNIKKTGDSFDMTNFSKQILLDFNYTHDIAKDAIRLYKTKNDYYIQEQMRGKDDRYYKIKDFDNLLKFIRNIELLLATKKYNL